MAVAAVERGLRGDGVCRPEGVSAEFKAQTDVVLALNQHFIPFAEEKPWCWF